MIQQEVQQLLNEASADLELMTKESDRLGGGSPEFIICWTVKNCISKLLFSYLRANAFDTGQMLNVTELINHCMAHDKEFNKIDVEQLECRNSTSGDLSSCYCMSQGQMKFCIEEANKIKEIVYRKLELN